MLCSSGRPESSLKEGREMCYNPSFVSKPWNSGDSTLKKKNITNFVYQLPLLMKWSLTGRFDPNKGHYPWKHWPSWCHSGTGKTENCLLLSKSSSCFQSKGRMDSLLSRLVFSPWLEGNETSIGLVSCWDSSKSGVVRLRNGDRGLGCPSLNHEGVYP